MCVCKETPAHLGDGFNEFEDKMRDILEKIYDDSFRWISIYKCRDCGQLWFEHYEQTSYHEIPVYDKINAEQAAKIIPK